MRTLGYDKSKIVYGERDSTWDNVPCTCEMCGLVMVLEGKDDVQRRETFESDSGWYAQGTVICPECGHGVFMRRKG